VAVSASQSSAQGKRQWHRQPPQVYIAGDATLQRTADEGRIASYNAARPHPTAFQPKTRMSIVFYEPNIASVGATWSELDPQRTAVGQVRFGPVGRVARRLARSRHSMSTVK